MEWIGKNAYLTEAEMKNNATLIWNYFRAKGWTINSVCAMLGNMQSESTINPNIWEGLELNYERGYGLVQWTPATKYIDWGGDGYESGYKQCERIQYEVDNGLQWFSNPNAPIVDPPITFKEFTTSDLPVGILANYFLWYYEHPATTIQPNRSTQAQEWYNYLFGSTPTPVPRKRRKMPVWLMLRYY